MTDWLLPCSWFAEAAGYQAKADRLRALGREELAAIAESLAEYNEAIAMGGVDGSYESLEER